MTLHGGSIEKENGNTPNTNNSNIELNQLFHTSPPHPSQIRRSHHTKPITHGTVHVLTTPNSTPQRQHFSTTPPQHLHINSDAATTTTPANTPSHICHNHHNTSILVLSQLPPLHPSPFCRGHHHPIADPSQLQPLSNPSPQLKFIAVQPVAKNRSKKNRTGKELRRRYETRWCGEQAATSRTTTTTTTHEPRAEPKQRRNPPPI